MKSYILLFVLCSTYGVVLGQSKSLKWDSNHSNITFEVQYRSFGVFQGMFTDAEANITYTKDDFSDLKVSMTVDVNSINTNNDKRDQHLRSPDFFDAARYPDMKFISSGIKAIGNDRYEIEGNLTIKGITKEIKGDLKLLGSSNDTQTGSSYVFWKVDFSISRKEFSISHLPVIIGEEVTISINAACTKTP